MTELVDVLVSKTNELWLVAVQVRPAALFAANPISSSVDRKGLANPAPARVASVLG